MPGGSPKAIRRALAEMTIASPWGQLEAGDEPVVRSSRADLSAAGDPA